MLGMLYSVSALMSMVITVMGAIMSVMSLSFLGLWVGIEVNFLGAICFMSGVSVEESESVMKYFIIQVMGSSLLILGFLMGSNFVNLWLVNYFIMIGAMVKLGVFPFHFWVASVMSGLSWYGCFVVSVVQKIVPLWLLSNCIFMENELSVIELLASLTCVVGCLSGLGVLSYRVLLAYSSIVHLGMLIILCCSVIELFWFYLIVYGFINLCLMGSLWKLSIYSFHDLVKEKNVGFLSMVWWSWLYFLSLAGLPPFTGCMMKVYFLVNCWNFMSLGCLICVISSAVSLYFYLGVVLNMVIFWGKSLSMVTKENSFKTFGLGGLSVFVNLGVGLLAFLMAGL